MSLRPVTSILRHVLAGIVTLLAGLVSWTVLYLVLFLWAMLTGSGLGGPLAYPVGLLAILVTSVIASLLIFLPATLLSEIICRRHDLPRVLAGIPLVCAISALLVFGLTGIVGLVSPPPDDTSILVTATSIFLALLLPLGCYWWTSQSPALLTRVYQKLRPKTPPSSIPNQ